MRNMFMMVILLFVTGSAYAQIERVEPPNWWVEMNTSTLQLLVKGANVGEMEVSVDYPGIEITETHKAESPNYLFVDIEVDPNTEVGEFEFTFKQKGEKAIKWPYEIKGRERRSDEFQGFNSSDVIYLITPDRFANGNPNNDSFDFMRQKGVDRKAGYARHGGDIRGIINSLDYMNEMGFTALWSSPLLENDMPAWSYHGYAITNFYKPDPRFGTMDEYIELAQAARERDIKLIFDGVVNHCGRLHWWMEDMPFKDWVNYPDSVVLTTHRRTVNVDPYASEADRKIHVGGWFVPDMPDLNQANPYMATYLIQNSIWWIETLQLGGIRQDTYPYPDKDFLTEWTCAIMNEYPAFSIVGEEWSYNPLLVAYWQQGKQNKDGYKSCLKSTMDFPMQQNIQDALTKKEEWGSGLIQLYEGLANDFVYANPMDIMTFVDNHDMDRIHTQLKEDADLTKMAIGYLLTTRGIPQIYYGTEVLLQNTAKPGDHGLIRTDFPGGWENDKVDGFNEIGLKEEQADMQEFMRKLLNYRKGSQVLQQGKTMHFAPEKGTYVYFRFMDDKKVMVVLNKNTKETELKLGRFGEILPAGSSATDIISGKKMALGYSMGLAPKSVTILEIE
ncbi:MAG: glycoside hydrolase family 13 protein [Bacteroidota bacterium]